MLYLFILPFPSDEFLNQKTTGFIEEASPDEFTAKEKQELIVKLFWWLNFIADNIFCKTARSFIVSLIVLSIWHFALKMLWKSYPDS